MKYSNGAIIGKASSYGTSEHRPKSVVYKVMEIIGFGVLGTCYKVKCIDDDMLYVAKEISITNRNNFHCDPTELTVTDGCNGQFNKTEKMKEVAIMTKLKNKYVIELLDYFIENGNIYLVTEFCEKGDVLEYMNRAVSLSKSKIWKFTIEMMIGLAYLHEK